MRSPELRIITPYSRQAGSSRVRVFDWLDHLGIQPPTLSLTRNGRVDPGSRADTLVHHARALRWMNASAPLFVHREASLVGRGLRRRRTVPCLVYDLDDAIYLSGVNGTRSRRASLHASEADVVIAGNSEIAAWASELCDNVVVIPSCVDPHVYKKKTDYRIEQPRAVWIGSASTEEFLDLVSPALTAAKQRFGLRVDAIGSAAPNPKVDPVVDQRIPWSPEAQHELLATYDFGIMPLPDSEFARGKCGYKILQYGAAGLPVIASPVGVNTEIMRKGQNWAAADNDQWLEAIDELIHLSEDERGVRARVLADLVDGDYSFEANEEIWRSTVLVD